MDAAQALALAAFIALAAGLSLAVRRTGRLVAKTRATEGFRRSVADLARRVDESLDGAASRIDAVRRHSADADSIAEVLTASKGAVERYLDEAKGLGGPTGSAPIREAIVSELERAARALDSVEHGCAILVEVRSGGRQLEAETAIKRGYLNVLHAREAILRSAVDAEDLADGEARARRIRRARPRG